MTLGIVLLAAVVLLTFLGLTHRVFDRLHLSDAAALVFIGLLIAGSFVNVTLVRRPIDLSVNLGGLVPIALAIYVLVKANSATETWRAILATIITTAALFATVRYLIPGFGHGRDVLDPLYIYGIEGGIIAYIAASRSRRASFVAATLGTTLLQVVHLAELLIRRSPGTVAIGGAGAFDAIVIAGILAVLLAELVGESRERLGGGHKEHEDRE